MKKWTYLVASLLLAGTTPLLTGCVDTDEPSGIEELRGAKAELLKAKAAVEAAKVATVQAEAAYKNAQAEYQKALAAYALAQAAREEAGAANDKAAAEQALAEAIERANQATKQWELEYQILQQTYNQALINLLSSKETALSPYKTALSTAKKALDDAADDLTDAQRAYAKALAKLEETEAQKELLTRELQFKVVLAERNVEGRKEAVAAAKAEYEAAQNLELHEVAVKRDEMWNKIQDQVNTVTDLEVAAAEGYYQLQTTELPSVIEALEAYDALWDEDQVLPAFSLEFKGGLPFGLQGTIDSEKAYYSLYDETNYYNRLNALQGILKDVKSWVRDENDDAWTAERIAKLEDDLAKMKKVIAATETKWKEAVAAYNTNKADVTDPTKVTGYAELKAGLEAYNAAAKTWSDLNLAIYNAQQTIAAASKAYTETILAIQKAHTDAYAAADKAYNDGVKAAPEQAKTKKAALKKAEETALKEYQDAQKALAGYTGSDTEKIKELAQAVAAAQIVYEAAVKANLKDEAQILNDIMTELSDTRDEAKAAADKKQTADTTAATAEKDATIKAQNDIIAASNKALPDAQKALDAAVAAIDKADGLYDKFNEAASGTGVASGLVSSAAYFNYDKNGVAIAKQVSLDALTKLDKAALTGVINVLSNQLYGTGLYKHNAYGDFEARLKPYTEAQIKEMAEAEIAANQSYNYGLDGNIASNLVSYNDYAAVYNTYGLMGQIMIAQEFINLNKSYIGNDKEVESLITALEAAITEIEAANEAAWENLAVEYYATMEVVYAYVYKVADLYAPVEEAAEKLMPMFELYMSYVSALDNYVGLDPNTTSQSALDNYIELCKNEITTQEDKLYKAETKLMQAKQDLADWNNGTLTKVEKRKQDLEDAQTDYNRAEEAYQAALDALNAAIEYLSTIK